MPRLFTLNQAERLLPRVEGALRRAIRFKTEYEKARAQLAATRRDLSMLGGVIPDRERLAKQQALERSSVEQLKEAVAEIEEIGCLLKDLDMGLIDFLTRYRNQEVCLCWKLGEDGIRFWHGLEEGFRGRKPIDSEFIAGHRGEGDSGHA